MELRPASVEKVKERESDILLLLQFIESIGGCGADFVSDETLVSHLINDFETTEEIFRSKLSNNFNLDFHTELPEFVDLLNAFYPDWISLIS